MKYKKNDVREQVHICLPSNDGFQDFIKELQDAKDNLITNYNCFPESIGVTYNNPDEYSEYLEVFGHRPENEKEKAKRLERERKEKERQKIAKDTLRNVKYQEYLKLKKEFENE